MKKAALFFYLLVLVCAVLLTGCPSGNEGPTYDSGTWVVKSDSWVEFTCNDPAKSGRAFFYTYETESSGTSTGISAQLKRLGGSPSGGYGLVTCYKNPSNFYRALISTHGSYQVGKIIDGKFTALTSLGSSSWKPSIFLEKGYDASNKVKFVLENSKIILTINEKDVFTADEDSSLTSGRAGFFASVFDSDVQNFPDTPVKLQFKKDTIYPSLNMAVIREQAVLSETVEK